jgi:hypothetical protein
MESFDVASRRKLMDAAAKSICPHQGRASTIAATVDRLRLVWLILARVSARAKIVTPPSRQEKGVTAISIIPRSRRLDAK